MAIFIKNPETERKARELASLRGMSITSVIDGALEAALAQAMPPPKRTLESMLEATRQLRRDAGTSGPLPPMTKADWDELNEIPGLEDDA